MNNVPINQRGHHFTSETEVTKERFDLFKDEHLPASMIMLTSHSCSRCGGYPLFEYGDGEVVAKTNCTWVKK